MYIIYKKIFPTFHPRLDFWQNFGGKKNILYINKHKMTEIKLNLNVCN